eukprot:1176468-Amphidinium_carterae.1
MSASKFLAMLRHHRRCHNCVPLEAQTACELRALVADFLVQHGASPALAAGVRGSAHGGTADQGSPSVWSMEMA